MTKGCLEGMRRTILRGQGNLTDEQKLQVLCEVVRGIQKTGVGYEPARAVLEIGLEQLGIVDYAIDKVIDRRLKKAREQGTSAVVYKPGQPITDLRNGYK